MSDYRPRWYMFALHVFALSGFALAQPVYSWLSAQPDFLVAHDVGLVMLLLAVAVLSFAVPLVLVGAATVFRLGGSRSAFYAQVALIALLCGVFVLHLSPPVLGEWAWGAGAIALVMGALAYTRYKPVRDFLSLAAVGAVLFPVLFLMTEPVRGLNESPERQAGYISGADTFAEGGASYHTVVVMVDELSTATLLDAHGNIDAQRFPGFARLAGNATWYPRAATVAPWTIPTLTALVTGNLPEPERLEATAGNYPRSLFAWAPKYYGDEVQVREFHTTLCPRHVCPSRGSTATRIGLLLADLAVLVGYQSLPAGSRVSGLLPSVDDRVAGFAGFEALGEPNRNIVGVANFHRGNVFGRFVEGLDAGFYFEHLTLPHRPLDFLPDGERYDDMLGAGGYNPYEPERMHLTLDFQAHLAQAQYVDSLINDLIDGLKARQMWDDTLLIVVSDHGRYFEHDGHWRRLDANNLGMVLGVPFFIKQPGQQSGSVDEYPASVLDVAPTVADVLGTQLPWSTQGVSLVASSRPEREYIPITCVGVARGSCDRTMIRMADRQREYRLPQDDFYQALVDAQEWVQDNRRYAPGAGLFVPPVPEADLLGRELSTLPIDSAYVGHAALFEPGVLDNLDVADDYLPAMVAGYIEADGLGTDEWLLAALNDRLAAVVHLDRGEGGLVFGALLPAEFFQDGDNRLRLFRVKLRDDGSRVLREIDMNGQH